MTATPSTRARLRAAGLLARRALREPLVQFALGGGALFLLYAAVQPPAGGDPGEQGVGVSVSRAVTVGPRDLELQRASFRAAWKREPDTSELADLMEAFISEEMLFREGAALGLDRDDTVVRRRLIEKATALARPSAPVGEPDAAELRRWYQMYPHRFQQPAAFSLEQLYFDTRKHADAGAAATAALVSLANQPAGKPAPQGVGDEFVLPTSLTDRSQAQLSHLFGTAFTAAVEAAPLGRWHGPVRSNYGLHLVRVMAKQASRLPPFEETERHVRADWLTAHNRGLRDAALGLLPRYQLQIDPAVRKALAGAPAIAPFLERAR
jgi:peptidyl-prolyl cis-trans isomerase C